MKAVAVIDVKVARVDAGIVRFAHSGSNGGASAWVGIELGGVDGGKEKYLRWIVQEKSKSKMSGIQQASIMILLFLPPPSVFPAGQWLLATPSLPKPVVQSCVCCGCCSIPCHSQSPETPCQLIDLINS